MAFRSTTRTETPSGKRFVTVARSIHGCWASLAAIGARSSVATLRPRHEANTDRISSVRVRELPEISNLVRANRSPPTNRASSSAAAATATPANAMRRPRGFLLRRSAGALPRRRNGASLSADRTLQVLLAEPDDVAGAQRQKQVPGAERLLQALGNSFLFRRINHVRVPGAAGGIGHHLPRDAGQRRLPRGVHVEHEVDVGAVQRLAELAREVAGPRVQMRLEQRDEPPLRVDLTRGGEGGADLRRMVGVVVHDEDPVALALALEAADDPRERAERPGDRLEGNEQLAPDRDG